MRIFASVLIAIAQVGCGENSQAKTADGEPFGKALVRKAVNADPNISEEDKKKLCTELLATLKLEEAQKYAVEIGVEMIEKGNAPDHLKQMSPEEWAGLPDAEKERLKKKARTLAAMAFAACQVIVKQ
jgi:hypothetical protein